MVARRFWEVRLGNSADANLSMKYAAFSCGYPAVGCYLYGLSVMSASHDWIMLFPVPIVLLVVALGLRYTWHHRTREHIKKLVRGNLVLALVWVGGGLAIRLFQNYHLLARG